MIWRYAMAGTSGPLDGILDKKQTLAVEPGKGSVLGYAMAVTSGPLDGTPWTKVKTLAAELGKGSVLG